MENNEGKQRTTFTVEPNKSNPMANRTIVKTVAVYNHCHSPLNHPKEEVRTAGNSEIKWTFKGTYLADNQCVLVLQAEKLRGRAASRVKSGGSGGVFPTGKDGCYCELTIEGNDQDNWSMSVGTERDAAESKDFIFTAGTGAAGD